MAEVRKDGVVLKVRSVERLECVEQRDKNCLLHHSDPFANGYAPGRKVEAWEFSDQDAFCTCVWEKREAFPRVTAKVGKDKKACPKCHYQRAKNGSCAC